MKKAWESIPSLVPHFEALALPNQPERATQKPTPVCISHLRHTLYIIRYTSSWRLHTHGHLPLPCSLTDLKLARFRSAKNKASSKRLYHIYVPHSRAASLRLPFPTLGGLLHWGTGGKPARCFCPRGFGRGSHGQIYKFILRNLKKEREILGICREKVVWPYFIPNRHTTYDRHGQEDNPCSS